MLRLVRQPDSQVASGVLRLSVTDSESGVISSVAFDVFDRGDLFDIPTLEAADVYFKNTFQTESQATLSPCLAEKVKPAGLIFACYMRGTRLVLARVALEAFQAHWKALGLKRGLRRLRHDLLELEGILDIEAWERRGDEAAQGHVVFQTRIWPPERDSRVDREGVNHERIELVRALKKAFGAGDRIGLLHTRYATETAPDLLTSRKVPKRQYARQLKTSLVAVNSHGLDGSAGFKIAESLAAGAALVSQPFRFELPRPLVEGVNYLSYETPEECVSQCRRLLADRDLVEAMRAANQDYYRRYVRPDAAARNMLAEVFQGEAQ